MTSGEISGVFKKEKNCLMSSARGRLLPLGGEDFPWTLGVA